MGRYIDIVIKEVKKVINLHHVALSKVFLGIENCA